MKYVREMQACSNSYFEGNELNQPVPMAARSKARTVFDPSNTGIGGSNPARGMDVSPRFCVLCCPV
jgi:hypothetical protein